jgi:hypothetical protein
LLRVLRNQRPIRQDANLGTPTHRALELRPPQLDERRERSPEGEIRRRDRLGGLIHEYLKGANICVASPRSQGWEDRRLWLFLSSTSLCGLCLARRAFS